MKKLGMLLLASFWTGPATAAPQECAGIEDDTARLACFDTYFTPIVDGANGESTTINEMLVEAKAENSLVKGRMGQERAVADQFFALLPHHLNYFLPATISSTADYSDYGPFDEWFDEWEVKFQLSLKALVAENLWRDSSIWLGYTQQSYWQLYAEEEASAPFRETNYQPELFWAVPVDFDVMGWHARLATLALNHQSNGRSEPLSRSWNRITGELALDRGPFAATVKTWYRLPEEAENDNNPDIEDYMGRVELGLAYKRGEQLFSMSLKNNLSSDNRSGLELNWTFPLVQHLRGFVQIYSGYGENLLDADNYNNRFGIGVSLSDRL